MEEAIHDPAPDVSDETLLGRHRNGDRTAFEMLVRRHGSGILGFLTRMVRDRARAEDLFQETFLRVHVRADSFDTQRRFKSWLYAIAAHAAIDALRQAARDPAAFSLDAEDHDGLPAAAVLLSAEQPHPSEPLTREERKARVQKAIATLPPRQRATVQLAYFEGLTYSEVASALDCSVGTVKTQMSRAMQTLARSLPHDVPGGGT